MPRVVCGGKTSSTRTAALVSKLAPELNSPSSLNPLLPPAPLLSALPRAASCCLPLAAPPANVVDGALPPPPEEKEEEDDDEEDGASAAANDGGREVEEEEDPIWCLRWP